MIAEAGAASVKERALNFATEAPVDLSEFWEFRTEMSDSFRKNLATMAPDRVNEARAAALKASAVYFESGSMSFPSQVLLVSGRKAVDEE